MATYQTVGSGAYQFAQMVTLNPANVTANSVSVETLTVTGVQVDKMYFVDCPTLETGLVLFSTAIPTALNTLQLKIWNLTGADINPASQSFRIIGF